MNKEEFAYSMPPQAGLYGSPPYHYEDLRLIQILYKGDKERLSRIVPEPLTIEEGELVSCVVAYYPKVSKLDAYYESFFLIAVRYNEISGVYCPYMWVNTDVALAAGREIWGFPKKMAQISLFLKDGIGRGIVERSRVKLIEVKIELKDKGDSSNILFGDMFTLKIIPSIDRDKSKDIRLNLTKMENVEFTEIKGGPVNLILHSSPLDPLYLLEPVEVKGGIYAKGRWTLPFGKTIAVIEG